VPGRRIPYPFPAIRLILLLPACSPGGAAAPHPDENELRHVVERYTAGWLSGDSAAVMGALAPDAVFTPHHGLMPLEGDSAIRQWWFPAASPPIKIVRFTLSPEQTGGSDSLAYAWGRLDLAWENARGGAAPDTATNAGTWLFIFRRDGTGGWRIAHLTSSDTLPRGR
jgi:uncharacterized protein (TIGR02246 family)